MVYYPDSKRVDAVIECFREHGPMTETRELYVYMREQIPHRTVYKIVRAMMDDGILTRRPETSPTGKMCFRYYLELWYELSDEQRERMVCALERIADALEGKRKIEAKDEPKEGRQCRL